MRELTRTRKILFGALALLVLTCTAAPAMAIDGYQDRKGLYGGLGTGGGVEFLGSDPGGGLFFDAQLGAGATQNFTLALDMDFWTHVFNGNKIYMLTPGPEVNFYIGDTGLFIRAGVGMAMTWPKNQDFMLGFDTSLGAGYEFFGGANTAMALAVEGDYMILDGPDIASIIFALNVKFY